jgi:diaminohydroxyphosphoribosylaminopyrimidine deaminase/5-amino-6-(5-phosphoribosylamino)uracil reductase
LSESAGRDARWLDAAARLATPWLGATGAAPAAAALVVDEPTQLLYGRGLTPFRGLGQPELIALGEARGVTRGRTLYTTLEPTARFTNAPPVVPALVEAGIGRVVAGALDPDRAHAGQGLAALAAAGIDAVHLPHAGVRLLNEGYAMRVAKGRSPGQKFMVSPEALRWLERQRAAADAVLSGAARAAIENNDLSVHLPGLDTRGALRVVLAGTRQIDESIELFAAVSGAPLLVVTTEERPLSLPSRIETLAVPGRRGRPDIRAVLAHLAARGVSRLLVEAGAALAESFIAGELVDRLHVLDIAVEIGRGGVPAALLGGFDDRIAAARFSEVDQRRLGADKVRTFERA